MLVDFWSLDFVPLSSACFVSVACALLGNFLVLRRIGLMGDAISHVVLPGIVLSFTLFGSRGGVVLFIGAALAGIFATLLIEVLGKISRIDAGASMGVVFSSMFALGVLLLEQASARNVDLDADCLLYGQLETLVWFPKSTGFSDLISALPIEFFTSSITMLLSIAFVVIFYKELKISAFDPGLSNALGFNSNLLHYLQMVVTALAVVASFEAVGSILVIGMLICPAASARLLTDRLHSQILASIVLALLATISGYLLAANGPGWFGWDFSLNSAGFMLVMSGVIFATCFLFSPRYGWLVQRWRQRNLGLDIDLEDLLAWWYRQEEVESRPVTASLDELLCVAPLKSRRSLKTVVGIACRRGMITKGERKSSGTDEDMASPSAVSLFSLSEAGRQRGRELVRTHRLWEHYLEQQADLHPLSLHDRAHHLEHVTDSALRKRLSDHQKSPEVDPHGRPIPPESD